MAEANCREGGSMGDEKGEAGMKPSLDASVRDGILFSIMTGLGDAYMAPLLVFYGASNVAVGALATVQQLCAAFAQLFVSRASMAWRNRKRLVTVGATIHAFFWLLQLALLLSPMPAEAKIPLAIGIFGIYMGLNAFIAPSWAGWIADLVPETARGQFFGWRNSTMGIALFFATLGGGLILGYFAGAPVWGFALLFAIAFLCRLASASYLSRMAEIAGTVAQFQRVEWRSLFFVDGWADARRFIIASTIFSVVTQIASPFFAVFMLRDLQMSYVEYGALLSMSILAKIVSYRYWGRLADMFGNRAVMITTTILGALVPLPWVIAPTFEVLIFAQILSGFAWSGFELVSFNYVLSSAPRERRVSLVSRYNFFNSASVVAGSAIGAALISGPLAGGWWGLRELQTLFLVSAALRIVVALIMIPHVREQHLKYAYDDRAFIINSAVVYPTQSAVRHLVHGINFAVQDVPRELDHTMHVSEAGRAVAQGLRSTADRVRKRSRRAP